MGFFKKVFKKITNPIKKVVKKVTKGITKVAKSIVKGVKSVAKSVGKAVTKLGPLASIAIGFIPGFQALWANAGIWGAIGKGAITGFVTSGGKMKGALVGAVGGGIGYGLNAGMDAYNKGYGSLGESASISDKISAGFKSVGQSTSDGVSNMYKSAEAVFNTGDVTKVNYLTDGGQSVYDVPHQDVGSKVYDEAGMLHVDSIENEIQNYQDKLKVGREQAEMLWEQTGGQDIQQSFDWEASATTPGQYDYTGEGLETTMSSANLIKTPGEGGIDKSGIADAVSSLLGGNDEGSENPYIPYIADTSKHYSIDPRGGGLSASASHALGFAESYGGARDPRQLAAEQGQTFKSLLVG